VEGVHQRGRVASTETRAAWAIARRNQQRAAEQEVRPAVARGRVRASTRISSAAAAAAMASRTATKANGVMSMRPILAPI
jgi:hypothetical protein